MGRRCIFRLGDMVGQYHGTRMPGTWNGFDNVAVDPVTRGNMILDMAQHGWEDDGGLEDIPTNEDGLVDLSGGFATVVIPAYVVATCHGGTDWCVRDASDEDYEVPDCLFLDLAEARARARECSADGRFFDFTGEV